MRKLKYFILCILLALSAVAATACAEVEFDYNIDFSVDGKIISTVGTNGDKIAMPKDPEKDGYTFDGWYWDDGVWEKQFTLNSILDQPIKEKNSFTVYAKWKSAVYYTIVFDANGGSGEMPDKTAATDEQITLSNSFTPPEDYVSDGFNTKADGSGTAYADGATAENLCKAGETVTLYAQWRERERFYYTIVFDGNGGSGEMNNLTAETDVTVKLSYNGFTPPEDTGFDGWNTKADGSGTPYANGAEVKNLAASGDTVTLYAQWLSYYYTVEFEANGGSGEMPVQKLFANWTGYLNKNAFTRDYHTFIGWNTKADGSGSSYDDRASLTGECKPGETLKLYAQWQLDEGVTFINNASDVEKVKQNLSGIFVLTADIDYQGRSITPIAANGSFNGTFDGNGHTIKNFTYTPSNPDFYTTTSGFFGAIGNSGRVCNLSLTGFTVTGFSVGAFAHSNYGVIENCYADGTVNCSDFGFPGVVHAGGIVGTNHGIVSRCLFSGRIFASLSKGVVGAGGITGLNMLSTENCLCTGDILIQLSGNASYEPISYVSLDYVNVGAGKNNYYLSGMSIALYKDDVSVKREINKDATTKSVSSSKLDSASFYTQTLGWDDKVWDLSELDSSTAKYPVLIKK